MDLANIISLMGGLAFFLFGMTLLGSGLKRVAGSRLETILGQLTSTPVRGVLLGALVTAVIQSSSATTVMVVGFVNSGIMQLNNAVGIVMGANIGTTATGWVLTLAGVGGEEGGFSSATVFAFIAFIGIILYFFCKKPAKKNLGLILLAFSVLMNGMQAMSAAMDPLKESPAFLDFIAAVSNPVAALIFGAAFTALIQSNSAAVGILQALSVTGAVQYGTAIPMILGMSIGACVPVLLSAIGANIDGKRTAFIYLYFNVIGSAILMIPFYIVNAVVDLPFMNMPASAFGIAMANTIYKLAATLIQLPFTKGLVRVATATIREKHPDGDDEFTEENLLDERFLQYPPLALEQSGKTVARMARAAAKNLDRAIELFSNFNAEKYEKILAREALVDRYEDRLSHYLVQLSGTELSERERLLSSEYLHSLTNLERISDHAVNLAHLAEELHEKDMSFSEEGRADMARCIEAMRELVSLALKALTEEDMEPARQVEPLEEVVYTLLGTMKSNHIHRLQSGVCRLEVSFAFNDCINDIERVSAHCSNIALAVLEVGDSNLEAHVYTRSIRQGNQPDFRHWVEFYRRKYLPETVPRR